MKKFLHSFCFVAAIFASFAFSDWVLKDSEPIFMNDAKKAFILLNVKELFSSPAEMKNFQTSFLKQIQSELAKEGYNLTIKIKSRTSNNEPQSLVVLLSHLRKESSLSVDVTNLRNNGQQLMIFLDKKSAELSSCEAENIVVK